MGDTLMFIGLLPLFGPLDSGGFINKFDAITTLFAEIGFFVCPDTLRKLGFIHKFGPLTLAGVLGRYWHAKY